MHLVCRGGGREAGGESNIYDFHLILLRAYTRGRIFGT